MLRPRFPPELLDQIVDHFHYTRDALKSCCLVSKSWVPRTRRHLFADVTFRTAGDLQAWKDMFPDPSTSPARYTKNLFVYCPEEVTTADAEKRSWLLAFSRVVHLRMHIDDAASSLVPFHGFSPALKSLSVSYPDFPFSQTLSLIRSFPLIEDLSLTTFGDLLIESDDGSDGQQTTAQPPLTGTLELYIRTGMNLVVSRLLSPPNGYRFRKLELALNCDDDIVFASVLVERCRLTLESLKLCFGLYGTIVLHPYPCHWLIPYICSRAAVMFDRPFNCVRTQGRGV